MPVVRMEDSTARSSLTPLRGEDAREVREDKEAKSDSWPPEEFMLEATAVANMAADSVPW